MPIYSVFRETKLQDGQIDLNLEDYQQYWNYAVKKGYSGTAVFTKRTPLSVEYGIGIQEHDPRGTGNNIRIRRFLSCKCLHTKFSKGIDKAKLQDGLGG